MKIKASPKKIKSAIKTAVKKAKSSLRTPPKNTQVLKKIKRKFSKKMSSFAVVNEYLKKIGGIQAVQVMEVLEKNNKPLKDEEIAKKIDSKVTEIRSLLNKLNYRGIADYDKRKDQNSGWYHYTWTLNEQRIVELLMEEQKKMLEKLEQRKEMQENYSIFSCKDECIEEPFETAMEYNFKCPKCGDGMKYIEFKKQVKKLERDITQIRDVLGELDTIKQ